MDADQRTSTEGIRETESIISMVKQLPGCEESDENDVIQWVNVYKCYQGYSDSDIRTVFLPPIVIPLLQPMHQAV